MAPLRKEKVLLVDDEVEFTSILAERLEARGLQVDTAASGEIAIDKIREGATYDVVVLDLSMPGMDGLETLQHLRAHNSDIQVILLTGRATLQKGVQAVKLGAREVLEKPADMDTLLEKIAEAKAETVARAEARIQQNIDKIVGSKGW